MRNRFIFALCFVYLRYRCRTWRSNYCDEKTRFKNDLFIWKYAIYTYKQPNVYRRDRWPAMVSSMKKKSREREWQKLICHIMESKRRAHRKEITEILYEMMNGEKCINNLSSLACHFMITLFKFFSSPLRFPVLFCLHLGLVLLLILSTAIHHINESLLLKVSIMLIEQSH